MKYKIVADSSSNIYQLDDFNYESVPLKIVAGDKHYTDNKDLDVDAMLADFKEYKGKNLAKEFSWDESVGKEIW